MKIQVGQETGPQSVFMKQILTQDIKTEWPLCANGHTFFSISPQNCSIILQFVNEETEAQRGQLTEVTAGSGQGTFLCCCSCLSGSASIPTVKTFNNNED